MYYRRDVEKTNKSHFQIQKSDLLFLLINAGLKCSTSRPELALAQLAWLPLQHTFQHIQVLVGLVIPSQALVCLLDMEAI